MGSGSEEFLLDTEKALVAFKVFGKGHRKATYNAMYKYHNTNCLRSLYL